MGKCGAPHFSSWGYERIQGALANLGCRISDTTVANILKAHGIEPAPDRRRQSTWKGFLQAHWDVLASVDFTTIEVWTKSGLVTCYLLFVMELATRDGCTSPDCTANPDESWMCQAARNLSDAEDGFLRGKKYLLMDRDTKFSEAFRTILEQAGVEAVRLPPRSPNLNPNLERFMRSVKEECLERMIFFGERSLQIAVAEFLSHFHAERNHQGLGNRLIEPGEEVGRTAGDSGVPGTTGRHAAVLLPTSGLTCRFRSDAGRCASSRHEVYAGDGSRFHYQAEKADFMPGR